MDCTCGTTEKHFCRMLKKARLLTRPTLARRDAPFPKQGRSSEADPRFTFHDSRFTVPESDARTLLADFFSILLFRILGDRYLLGHGHLRSEPVLREFS
jgi:hypothetical protein